MVTGVLPAAAGGTVSAFLRFPGLSRIAAVTRITGVMKRHESFFWRGQRAGRTESLACREGWFCFEQTERGRRAQSRPLPPAQSAPGRALALALGASVLFRRKVTRSGRNPRPQGRAPGSRGQLWAPQPAPRSPMARSARGQQVGAGPAALFPANQRHRAPRDARLEPHQLLKEPLFCSRHAWLGLGGLGISEADSPICFLQARSPAQHPGPPEVGSSLPAEPQAPPRCGGRSGPSTQTPAQARG